MTKRKDWNASQPKYNHFNNKDRDITSTMTGILKRSYGTKQFVGHQSPPLLFERNTSRRSYLLLACWLEGDWYGKRRILNANLGGLDIYKGSSPATHPRLSIPLEVWGSVGKMPDDGLRRGWYDKVKPGFTYELSVPFYFLGNHYEGAIG